MTNQPILGWIITSLVVIGAAGWLFQEVPTLLKKKFFSKKNYQHIKVGMYYKD